MSVCLKGDVARGMPEKLSNNKHGEKKRRASGLAVFCGAFSGQE
jgi:hypothetical protein